MPAGEGDLAVAAKFALESIEVADSAAGLERRHQRKKGSPAATAQTPGPPPTTTTPTTTMHRTMHPTPVHRRRVPNTSSATAKEPRPTTPRSSATETIPASGPTAATRTSRRWTWTTCRVGSRTSRTAWTATSTTTRATPNHRGPKTRSRLKLDRRRRRRRQSRRTKPSCPSATSSASWATSSWCSRCRTPRRWTRNPSYASRHAKGSPRLRKFSGQSPRLSTRSEHPPR